MKRAAFLGSKSLGHGVLKAMHAALPEHAWGGAFILDDRDDPRSCFNDLLASAEHLQVESHIVRTWSDVDAVLARSPVDLVVVSGWYRMIPVGRYASRTQFFGLHGSLLPAYRGNAPLVWQVINGEVQAGVSFFELGEGMDDGDLVAQAAFNVGNEAAIRDVIGQAERVSVDLVRAHLPGLVYGTAELTPQSSEGVSYCGLRTPADGRIDWTWGRARIYNFVRAQSRPYPGAFTRLSSGERVAVWQVEPDPRSYFAVPGSVVERRPGAIAVGTGDGIVWITEGEVEGADEVTPVWEGVRSLRARFT